MLPVHAHELAAALELRSVAAPDALILDLRCHSTFASTPAPAQSVLVLLHCWDLQILMIDK